MVSCVSSWSMTREVCWLVSLARLQTPTRTIPLELYWLPCPFKSIKRLRMRLKQMNQSNFLWLWIHFGFVSHWWGRLRNLWPSIRALASRLVRHLLVTLETKIAENMRWWETLWYVGNWSILDWICVSEMWLNSLWLFLSSSSHWLEFVCASDGKVPVWQYSVWPRDLCGRGDEFTHRLHCTRSCMTLNRAFILFFFLFLF